MSISLWKEKMILILLLTISIFSSNAIASRSLPPTNPILLSVNSPSDSQLLYADALFDKSDFDAAILEFKRYIFYNPQSALLDYVLYRIGQSHYYSHRPSDAQNNLERLLKDYPQSPFRLHTRFMLGKTFMDNEDFTRARNEFRLITESNINKKLSAQAQYLQAWSYLSERDWYSAIAEFRKVAEFQPFTSFEGRPGVCIPWTEKAKEYEKIMGDEKVLQKSWEEIDMLAYLFVWFVLIAA